MRKGMTAAIAIVALFVACVHAAAQRASPHDSTAATVDGAELTISYGRPYMRGRVIMGGLVPYGRVWCPGADEATTLSTTKPLTIGDVKVAAGRYTLWMLPSADQWTMIVNKQTGQWHTQYNSQFDLGRVALAKRTLPAPVDQLTFAIESAKGGGGNIVMSWETTEVSAPFTVVQ